MIKNTLIKLAFASLFLTLGNFSSFSQQKLGFFKRMKVKKILNEGKRMTYENDYRSALNEFRTVLSIDSANATANFRVAQCHFNLGKPRLGKRYALKALSLDPEVNKDVHYVLAGSDHQLGDLANAKKHYKIFNHEQPLYRCWNSISNSI